jgi:hypothetical protein
LSENTIGDLITQIHILAELGIVVRVHFERNIIAYGDEEVIMKVIDIPQI